MGCIVLVLVLQVVLNLWLLNVNQASVQLTSSSARVRVGFVSSGGGGVGSVVLQLGCVTNSKKTIVETTNFLLKEKRFVITIKAKHFLKNR